jgi:hypothetical protein
MGIVPGFCEIRAVVMGHNATQDCYDAAQPSSRSPIHGLHSTQIDREPRSQRSEHFDRDFTSDLESGLVVPEPENRPGQI